MKKDGKEIPERGGNISKSTEPGNYVAYERSHQGAVMWDATGGESDEVLGEGPRRPLKPG